jgi:serine palmitoyltransferase
MGKGERAHVDYTPPLSSSDIIPSKGKTTDSPVIFQPSTKPQEFDANVEKVPLIHLITTYLSYLILIVIGHCRDFVYKRTHPELYYHLNEVNGYAPIATGFGIKFLTRHILP